MAQFTFHHGGISVRSLGEAIAWHGRVLGFEVEKRFIIDAARSHTAMMKKGDLRFEIFEVEAQPPCPMRVARRSPICAPMASMSPLRSLTWRLFWPK